MSVGGAVIDAIRTLFLSLCEIVYRLIVVFFDIFYKLGTAEILRNSTVREIYSRVGLIIGIFMVFRVSFTFVQYVINPDIISDKQKGAGNIIKKVIIVIVLLGITPTLFREAYTLQGYLASQNLVGKIISGKTMPNNESGGKNLAWYAFSSFYKYNISKYEDLTGKEVQTVPQEFVEKCDILVGRDNMGTASDIAVEFELTNSFTSAYNCLDKTVTVNGEKIYVIDFEGNGLIAFAVGALILWMILMYTIQLGVRILQLAYLQLVAPIPILMYLDPKSNDMLSKWAKQCSVTFLDFFIRVGIMYFAIFLIQIIMDNTSGAVLMSYFSGSSWLTKLYVSIIMIIAVLIFANKIPKLLAEVFPSLKSAASLDYGLKPPKELKQVAGAIAGAATAGAVGLIGGGPGLANKLMGFAGGALKGGASGFKGDKISDIATARAAKNLKNRQIRENPNTTFEGRMEARFRSAFGFNSIPEEIDKQIDNIDKSKIRPLQDRLKEIDNDPVMKQKQSNDTVISAYKDMMNEAEKSLLKTDNEMINSKSRLDYLREHHGEIDPASHRVIDGQMISDAEYIYKGFLETKGHEWIDNHSSGPNANQVITRNMEVISKEVGHAISDAATAMSENKSAKQNNASIQSQIVNLEYEKKDMQKQIESYEKQKEQLNRSKEAPQADINAINNKK